MGVLRPFVRPILRFYCYCYMLIANFLFLCLFFIIEEDKFMYDFTYEDLKDLMGINKRFHTVSLMGRDSGEFSIYVVHGYDKNKNQIKSEKLITSDKEEARYVFNVLWANRTPTKKKTVSIQDQLKNKKESIVSSEQPTVEDTKNNNTSILESTDIGGWPDMDDGLL